MSTALIALLVLAILPLQFTFFCLAIFCVILTFERLDATGFIDYLVSSITLTFSHALAALVVVLIAIFAIRLCFLYTKEKARNHDFRLALRRTLIEMTPAIGLDAKLRQVANIHAIDTAQRDFEKLAIAVAIDSSIAISEKLKGDIEEILSKRFGDQFFVHLSFGRPDEWAKCKWESSKLSSEIEVFFPTDGHKKTSIWSVRLFTTPLNSNRADHHYEHNKTETKSTKKILKSLTNSVFSFVQTHPQYAVHLSNASLI